MNDSGDFTTCYYQPTQTVGWITTGGGTTTTSFTYTSGSYLTRSIGINNNDDICGYYTTPGRAIPSSAPVG